MRPIVPISRHSRISTPRAAVLAGVALSVAVPVRSQVLFNITTPFAENLAANPGPQPGDTASYAGSAGGGAFPVTGATTATSVSGSSGSGATVIISGQVTVAGGGPAGADVMVRASYTAAAASVDKREPFGAATVRRNISIGGTHVLQDLVSRDSVAAVGPATSTLAAAGNTGWVLRKIGDSFGVNIFSTSSTIGDATATDGGLAITGMQGARVVGPEVPGAPGPGLPGGFGAGGAIILAGLPTAVGASFAVSSLFGDVRREDITVGAETLASPLADNVGLSFDLVIHEQAGGAEVYRGMLGSTTVSFGAGEGAASKTGTVGDATPGWAGGVANTGYIASLMLTYSYDAHDGSGFGTRESLNLASLNFSTVPEPGAGATGVGLVLAGVAVWRRWRRDGAPR